MTHPGGSSFGIKASWLAEVSKTLFYTYKKFRLSLEECEAFFEASLLAFL